MHIKTMSGLAAAFVLLLSGCGTPIDYHSHGFVARYSVEMTGIGVPSVENMEHPQSATLAPSDGGTLRCNYSDQRISIAWYEPVNLLGFRIDNRTQKSISILWDEAAFVDQDGKSHRLIHGDITYDKRNDPQPPSIIVRGGALEETVHPADYFQLNVIRAITSGLFYNDVRSSILLTSDMAPNNGFTSMEQFRLEVSRYVGKKLIVLLPIKIGDDTYEYSFEFTVRDVSVSINKKLRI